VAVFHPGFGELPTDIAVFPLTGALLLPQGKLPLNIFERRYLNMVEDALGEGRMFGMVQPDTSLPPGETGPALCRVGCLGRLSSFAETDDGRFLITLTGVIRYRVAEERPMRRLYRRVRPDYAGFESDLDLSGGPGGVFRLADRPALLGALRPYFRLRGIEANWTAIEQTPDGTLLTTLSMVCPFEPREKQALLEVRTPEERAQLLMALLQMATQAGPFSSGLGDSPSGGKPS
jgi:Lon protease-like protein